MNIMKINKMRKMQMAPKKQQRQIIYNQSHLSNIASNMGNNVPINMIT